MRSRGYPYRVRQAVEAPGCPVGLFVVEHGEQHVAASSRQADEGGVVFLAFGSLFVVVGAAGGVVQGGERGQEQRSFEFVVAGAVGDRGDAGVGGEVAGRGERGGVADFEQDAGCRS
jgi:hypothetical protein